MAELDDTREAVEAVRDWACDLLVRIATEHLMTRRTHTLRRVSIDVCGICGERWPCLTYRLATGSPE